MTSIEHITGSCYVALWIDDGLLFQLGCYEEATAADKLKNVRQLVGFLKICVDNDGGRD